MPQARRRLEDLEARIGARDPQGGVTAPETSVLLKAVERYRAQADGEPPPPYTAEELQTLYEYDLEDAEAGGCAVAAGEPGWQTDEARELLDFWQTEARSRLARIRSGEALSEVYEEMDTTYRKELEQ